MSPRGYKYEPSGPAKSEESIEIPEKFKKEPESNETNVIENKSVKSESSQSSPQTFVVKTELDAYINERLQTQPKTLDEIQVKEAIMPGEGVHALTLPREVKAALDKRNLSAYWINKKKKAIDRALNDRGWTLVSKIYFPEIPKHNFTANGTIEAGDCILGFMPKASADKLRRIPGQISQERVKNLPIERYKDDHQGEKINYYKPALTQEKDGETMSVGLQPDKNNEE